MSAHDLHPYTLINFPQSSASCFLSSPERDLFPTDKDHSSSNNNNYNSQAITTNDLQGGTQRASTIAKDGVEGEAPPMVTVGVAIPTARAAAGKEEEGQEVLAPVASAVEITGERSLHPPSAFFVPTESRAFHVAKHARSRAHHVLLRDRREGG